MWAVKSDKRPSCIWAHKAACSSNVFHRRLPSWPGHRSVKAAMFSLGSTVAGMEKDVPALIKDGRKPPSPAIASALSTQGGAPREKEALLANSARRAVRPRPLASQRTNQREVELGPPPAKRRRDAKGGSRGGRVRGKPKDCGSQRDVGAAAVPGTPDQPGGLSPLPADMAAVAGLRASYHRLLDRIELKLPPRLRPLYNHPAGTGRAPRGGSGRAAAAPPFRLGRAGPRSSCPRG